MATETKQVGHTPTHEPSHGPDPVFAAWWKSAEWRSRFAADEVAAQLAWDAAKRFFTKPLIDALAGLEYRDDPGRFCDHAAEPCPRCEAARAAIATAT